MTLLGVDVSHWEPNIDWRLVATTAKFAICKCTEGVSYFDDTYLANKAGCQANGIPFGAYHFFRSNVDPIAQANNFWNHVGPGVKVIVADVETNDIGLMHAGADDCQAPLNDSEVEDLRANLRTFMGSLEILSGLQPFIYTSPGFWNTYGIHDPAWQADIPLWVADWRGFQNPQIPIGWTSWVIWQYSDKGTVPGINGYVDVNRYPGTEEQLRALFGNGQPQPLPSVVRVTASVLNVRSQPMGIIVGQVKQGWLLGVNGDGYYGAVRWFKIGTGYVSSEWVVEA